MVKVEGIRIRILRIRHNIELMTRHNLIGNYDVSLSSFEERCKILITYMPKSQQ